MVDVAERPIFVVGAPRSGTSMMQWALRQHPDLWGGQESDFIGPLLDALDEVFEFGSTRDRLHWLSGQHVDRSEFLRHIGYGLNSLYTSRSEGLRWVEQTPLYTLYLDGIADLFPDAQFIYMQRDGRSVVHSLRNFVNPMEHDEATETWRRYTEAATSFAASDRGSSMLTIRYETVVADTDGAMRTIYDFLNLPHELASVAFIEKNRPINSSFTGEESREKIGPRWASWNSDERHRFLEIAGDLLIETGFESDDSWIDRA